LTSVQKEQRASTTGAVTSALATTPFRAANVVAVVNASDHDHFAVSGERPYHDACPPWARLTFIPDHDISETLLGLLEDGDVDAVVFASNALQSAVSQRAIAEQRFIDLWAEDGPAGDVGVLVLHQYLRPDAVLPLDFLGSGAFSLVGEPARRVDEADVRFGNDWRFAMGEVVEERDLRFLALARGYGPQKHCVWARFEFKYAAEWQPVAWERSPEQPLVAVCAAGDRVVAASRVPIDVTGAVELLGSLIAACLRTRGCLVVEAPTTTGSSAFTPALASAIDRHRFVHRARPQAPSEIDPGRAPYAFFDELIVAPEWRIDEIEPLTENALLRKLEQGGSIVASFSGPAGPVAVRLSGPPQYAERANHLASWLVPRLAAFQGDVWSIRALAEAVVATEAAYEEDRLIPQALRRDFVHRHLAESLAARVEDGNVDHNVLATVGTYAALSALGDTRFEGMRAWVDAHLDDDVPSVIAQALTLVPALSTPERRRSVREALDGAESTEDDARLLRAYAAVLLGDGDPDLLTSCAADRSLGLGVQAELLRAVVRHRIPASKAIVDLASHVRGEIDRLAAGEGALEAVCLGNAALIQLARQQGIGPKADIRGRSRQVDARTVENTELVKERETAVRAAEERRRAGQLAVTALIGLLALLGAVAIGSVVIWFEGDVGAKFGFATGILALMTTVIGFVTKRARDAGIPPWRI
jgi:hypothetical protein